MTNGVGLRADFSGAIHKTRVLKNIPKSSKYQATSWSAETLKLLMRSAAAMQKSAKYKKKTSMMMRNIGQQIAAGDERWQIAIGTGVGGKQSVSYASIQDKGGTTHPVVTERMKRWAWWAYYRFKEDRFKAIALTKYGTLTVNIPASEWFSGVIEAQEPKLAEMMSKPAVLGLAETMAGSSAGKLAGG